MLLLLRLHTSRTLHLRLLFGWTPTPSLQLLQLLLDAPCAAVHVGAHHLFGLLLIHLTAAALQSKHTWCRRAYRSTQPHFPAS
jgi:hypothetical protein